jgi:hypothetical protein
MAVKVGGQARMTLVHSLAPIGTDDRFVTSSIPVGDDQPGCGGTRPGMARDRSWGPLMCR